MESLGVVHGERRWPFVDPFKWFARIGYEPYEQQRAFHLGYDPAGPVPEVLPRFKVMVAGKRVGKSYAGARELEPLILTPETVTWIIGVQYSRAEKEFGYIWDDLFRKGGINRKSCTAHRNVRGGNMEIRTPWESVVRVISAKDPDNIESEACDQILIAEPAQHPVSTFELARERVMDKRGTIIIPGTPSVERHWLKSKFDRGQDPGRDDWFSIRVSAEETPYPGVEEVQRLREDISEFRYRRDVLAEFAAAEEMVYPMWEEGRHVREFDYDPELPLYTCHDFGFSDPWVTLWVQIDESQERVLVLDEYYETHRTDAVAVQEVLRQYSRTAWGQGRVQEDATGTLHLREGSGADDDPDSGIEESYPDPRGASARAELAKAGFTRCRIDGVTRWEGHGREGSISRGCELVRQWLETDRLWVHPRCDHTRDEFSIYHNARNGKPADEDNHTMDPIRYLMLNRFARPEPGVS
jgi:hypothetical protein